MFFIKILVKGYLKNESDDSILLIDTRGIKYKNKLNFKVDGYKYQLILNDNELKLMYENEEMKNLLLFSLKTITKAIIYVKKENITFELSIKTLNLNISKDLITVRYIIMDNEEKYELKIELGEYL